VPTETALDPRVQALLDKEEIRECVYRFARGVDRHDWDLVRSCYHDDGIDNHGPFNGPADEYVPWVREALPKLADVTMHTVMNSLIELDGDVAHSESYTVGYHRYTRADGTRWDWVSGARYVDRFERRDGVWKIANRVLTWEWVRDDKVVQEWEGFGLDDLSGFTWGTHDRSDPAYTHGRD
jgi:ketosteroid isomerase-like protein